MSDISSIFAFSRILLEGLDQRFVQALRSGIPEEEDTILEELGAFPPDTQPEYHIEKKDLS